MIKNDIIIQSKIRLQIILFFKLGYLKHSTIKII